MGDSGHGPSCAGRLTRSRGKLTLTISGGKGSRTACRIHVVLIPMLLPANDKQHRVAQKCRNTVIWIGPHQAVQYGQGTVGFPSGIA